jgi:hypothetical protein
LYIEGLNSINARKIKDIVTSELTFYMRNRYLSDKYKVKLLDNGSEITDKALTEKITGLENDINAGLDPTQYKSGNSYDVPPDKDLVGELEKKLTTEIFKIKPMNVNAANEQPVASISVNTTPAVAPGSNTSPPSASPSVNTTPAAQVSNAPPPVNTPTSASNAKGTTSITPATTYVPRNAPDPYYLRNFSDKSREEDEQRYNDFKKYQNMNNDYEKELLDKQMLFRGR